MKIGLVCPYNLNKGGGVQECTFAMQKELSTRGHEVLILTPQSQDNSKQPSFVRVLGTATDVKSPFHTTAQVSISIDTKQLEKVLDEEQFDILHFHEPWVPLLSKQILSRSTAKNVATFHAKLPDTVMSKTIEKVITPYTKSVLKDLDALTAVSDAAAEYVNGITDKKVNIIPNGINVNYYLDKKQKRDKTILYIGRLEKRKGIKHLLYAFELLQQKTQGIKLIIAGDGPDLKKLQTLASDLKLTNVEFLGFISDKQKLNLLHSSGVFCSPAEYGESFGIVLLEAMAAGLPIVAGDNPGYTSVMQGRGQLTLVNPRDYENFARRLEIMLLDEDIKSQMIEWSDEYIKKYDYSKIVDMYEKLYLRVIR